MSYTALSALGIVLSALLDLALLRTNLLRRRAFWTSYAIVVFFQLLVNGILTGRRIVTYNAADVIGGATPRFLGNGRIAYAPVEDLLFGFALVLQTLSWWVWWGRRENGGAEPSTPGSGQAERPPPGDGSEP